VGHPDFELSATFANPVPVLSHALITTPNGVEYSAAARIRPHLAPFVREEFAAGNPVDLAPAPDRGVYVLDAAAGVVRQFDAEGAFLQQLGASGAGAQQLSNPQALDVAADGSIFVADTGNHRIQVFDGDGAFLRSIGSPGTGAGQFSGPRGVAIQDGRLLVSDSGNARVQILTLDGGPIAQLPIMDPRGLAGAGTHSLLASPSRGLSSIVVAGATVERRALSLAEGQGADALPGAPIDVAFRDDGWLVADAANRVLDYDERGLLRWRIEALERPPLAVLQSGRREAETILVADGQRVLEIELPQPSPLPVLESLRGALAARNIEGALSLVTPFRRPHFRALYEEIAADLSLDAAAMESFELDLLREDRAIVRVLANDTLTAGSPVRRSYPVQLERGGDGSWQIVDY
jgi:hypothetical protein